MGLFEWYFDFPPLARFLIALPHERRGSPSLHFRTRC